jgi:ribosome maturation factor RimP
MGSPEMLEALVVPVVEEAGFRLVRLRVMGAKTKTLQIMAERPDGKMGADDCAALSRHLSEVLDAADPIEEEYALEVSSPGIDRPLTAKEDYARFAGHEARIELLSAVNGRSRFKGMLIALDGHDVVVDAFGREGNERIRFPFNEIKDAKLVLTDKLIQESLKTSDLKSKDKI